jgi:hypothetical protein
VIQIIPKAPAHPCLLQHYLQYPSSGKNQDATIPMNGLRKFGIYTMEFYSATKKSEILSFASKWMEPDNIILSKVSQA